MVKTVWWFQAQPIILTWHQCNLIIVTNTFVVSGGDILLNGPAFAPVPSKGITIATWVKLETPLGVQSIFDTVGSHSPNKEGQYHLEINDGRVRWFHRNGENQIIFKVVSQPVIHEGKWIHIAATYSSSKRRARVSILK